jgi:predicted phosphodiesterase
VPGTWRRVARWITVGAVGIAGAWVALLLVGPLGYPVGPFDVEYLIRPGPGRTDIGLPPFGRLSVDTHAAPLHLTATLVSVDPDQGAEAIRSSDIATLTATVEREGLSALRAHALRALAIAVVGAASAGLLVYRTRWRVALAATAAATTLLGAAAGLATTTYRPEAFLEPTYSGSLRTAARLLGPIREAGARLEEFRSEIGRLAQETLAAYEGLSADPALSPDAVAVLHVSDIHASPLGMDFAQQVADSFEVDLVLDTGDITTFGTQLETSILERISGFGVPYAFVQGNHDSTAVTAIIGGEPNAVILDGKAATVSGLTIFGAPHPLYTPDPGFDLSHEEIEEAVRQAGAELAQELTAAVEVPAVLAVHDDRMAEAAAGLVPLVVSGHFHEAGQRVIDGTLFLRTGTTGGGGLDTFRSEVKPYPLSAQILYFDGAPLGLVAVDLVELDPDTRNLSVERRLATDLMGGEPVPAPTPTG